MKTVKNFCRTSVLVIAFMFVLFGLPVNGALVAPTGGTYGFFEEILVEVSAGEMIRSISFYGPCWPGEGQEAKLFKKEVVPFETQNTFTIYPFAEPWDLVSGEYFVMVSVVLPGGRVTTYTSQRLSVETSIPLIRVLYPTTNVVFNPGENITIQFQKYGLEGWFSSVGLCVIEPSHQFSCTNDSALDLSQGQGILTNTFNWTIPSGYQDGKYTLNVYSANRQDVPGTSADFWVDSNQTVLPKITIEEAPVTNSFWVVLDDSAQPGMRRKWTVESSTNLKQWTKVTAPIFAGRVLVLSPSVDGKYGFFRAVEHK